MLQVVFGFLVFLFPVACYMAILAAMHRRRHPVFVPGIWDAVGLLFAVSGFLLVAGPAVLSMLYYRIADMLVLWDAPWLQTLWSQWGLIWGIYYGLVLLFAVLLIRSRRDTAVVYNIDPLLFDDILVEACRRAGVKCLPRGEGLAVEKEEELGSKRLPNLIKLQPFPAGYNVTLRWVRFHPRLRRKLERELQLLLRQVEMRENPCGRFFFGAAVFLLSAMIVTVLLMLLISQGAKG